jgi:hypothetical protein
MKLKLIFVLWPSFVVAGLLNSLFFTVFDPLDLSVNGEPLFHNRMVAYSIGFFVCWLFTGISSALTVFFERDREVINGYCPVPLTKRDSSDGLAH